MSDRPQHRDGPPVALTDDEIVQALTEHCDPISPAARGAAAQARQRIRNLRFAQEETNQVASKRIKELDDRCQTLHALVVRLVDVMQAADEPRLIGTRAFDEAHKLLKGSE